jgi:LAO/AO transport system kinase
VAVATDLTERLLAGERTALARLITWAENGDERFGPAIARLWSRVGRAARVGVTGPPGAGKSTLVNELARLYREQGGTVGVLAVDPSSPFSGGALLGDRIRMEERTLDTGVFIRSMASRESHGGLARASVDACDAMDAFGLDTLLIETVGVGQAEYDVVDAADTVLVVLCPGAGDGIQAMKAGLLEVGDVLVVNKADQPGAERLASDLEEAVHVRRHAAADAWRAPVVCCSAGRGESVDLVLAAIADHRAWLGAHGLAERRRAKRVAQVRRLLGETLLAALWDVRGLGARAAGELAAGRAPSAVAARLVSDILGPVPTTPAARETTR